VLHRSISRDNYGGLLTSYIFGIMKSVLLWICYFTLGWTRC